MSALNIYISYVNIGTSYAHYLIQQLFSLLFPWVISGIMNPSKHKKYYDAVAYDGIILD